jgi:hypothetical protein
MAREPATRALLDRIRADAPVTRRDYLRILVTVSGGLLAGAAGVAAGVFRRHGTGTAAPAKVADRLAPARRSPSATPGGTTAPWPSACPAANWSGTRRSAPTLPAPCCGAPSARP